MARDTYCITGDPGDPPAFAEKVNLVLRAMAQDILGGRMLRVKVEVDAVAATMKAQYVFDPPVDFMNAESIIKREFPVEMSAEHLQENPCLPD